MVDITSPDPRPLDVASCVQDRFHGLRYEEQLDRELSILWATRMNLGIPMRDIENGAENQLFGL